MNITPIYSGFIAVYIYSILSLLSPVLSVLLSFRLLCKDFKVLNLGGCCYY